MAITYTQIATVTVGASGTASFDFTSIPQTYTDLLIQVSARTTQAAGYGVLYPKFNGSTANITANRLYGGDTVVGSDTTVTAGLFSGANATTSAFGTMTYYVPNYTSSNNKTAFSDSAGETNATGNIYLQINGITWSQTAAITSLSLYSGNTIEQFSTATLYGIKNTV